VSSTSGTSGIEPGGNDNIDAITRLYHLLTNGVTLVKVRSKLKNDLTECALIKQHKAGGIKC